MITKILIGLAALTAALVIVLLIAVSTRPATFKVTRSAVIPASPDKVFGLVNNFHQWDSWSPWAKLDPNSKATFTGPEAGPGAAFAWAGNNEVGEGKMTITESHPNQLVRINLEFLKPFQATNLTEFTFAPQDGGTLVTWTMSGENNFVGKAMSLFMDCDKICGDMFEKGFANMKATVAANP